VGASGPLPRMVTATGQEITETWVATISHNAPYMRLIQQVRQAMRLGLLGEGDQLPRVKDVVARLAINPNTVLRPTANSNTRAWSRRVRGWARSSPTLTDQALAANGPLGEEPRAWLAKARSAGWTPKASRPCS
jgi:GntR family transcriptional regulator